MIDIQNNSNCLHMNARVYVYMYMFLYVSITLVVHDLPQVKWDLIFTVRNFVYKLPHKLLHDLKFNKH